MQQLRNTIQEWKDLGDTLIIGGDWNEDTADVQWTCFWTEIGLYEPAKKEEEDQNLRITEEGYKWTISTFCRCYDSSNLK